MELKDILDTYRDHIIHESVSALRGGLSERYRVRPFEELLAITVDLIDANSLALVKSDYSDLDDIIGKIVHIRHGSGFTLPEVHRALELYRTILSPIFFEKLDKAQLPSVLQRLNNQTGYCISKFSDYFQLLHERELRNHADRLEEEVRHRTSELAESEAKHRGLIEAMDDGYFVIQDRKIVFVNQAFCAIHGYQPSEVLGRHYSDFIARDSLTKVRDLHEEGRHRGRAQGPYIYNRLHKSGNSIPTENKVAFIVYQGQPAVAGICRDITERVALERRIREAERFAYIGELTTSLAHEIRNPLSSVKMNIQILLKSMKTDGKDNRRAEIVLKAISHLERILTEMLDFAKPLRLNLVPASINAVMESCLETLDVRLMEKQVEVKRKYSKQVADLLLDCDKIEQAVINLLVNSIEAIEKSGVIEITTAPDPGEDGGVRVEIRDNGLGVEKKDIPFVFDPFYSSKNKGTGLGLYNVRKIVEAHGGTIRLSSRRPIGTKVSFTLPERKTG